MEERGGREETANDSGLKFVMELWGAEKRDMMLAEQSEVLRILT